MVDIDSLRLVSPAVFKPSQAMRDGFSEVVVARRYEHCAASSTEFVKNA